MIILFALLVLSDITITRFICTRNVSFIIEIIRQRSSAIGKSSSDSEVAHGKGAKGKGRRSKVKERWPFLEGLTVDELARYRRRRVRDRPKDNLQPHSRELSDLVQDSASEYRRAFGANLEELPKVMIVRFLCHGRN